MIEKRFKGQKKKKKRGFIYQWYVCLGPSCSSCICEYERRDIRNRRIASSECGKS